MAITMQDVARLAGVSAKTVSNVVNGHPHVRPETRRRVEATIAKLGYEVNITARNLRRGRTGLISLALPELKLPYFAELADAIIAEAEHRGLRVLVEQTNYTRERELDILFGSGRAFTDGVIFSPLVLGPDDVHLFRVDFPLVLLGERVFGFPYDHVTMDNVNAADAATSHLLQRGRRRIAVVGVHPGEVMGTAALREQGYRRALGRAGIPVDETLLIPCGKWHRDTGAEAAASLLDSGVSFDAVFGLNDALAIGVLHVLSERGVRVPKDVAVIGFDDIEEASYVRPTLSSVSPGRAQIAREAVALLERRILEKRDPDAQPSPVQRILADFTVVARESTA